MRQPWGCTVVVLLLHALTTYAQNESGSYPLNKVAFQSGHAWYDSSTSAFEIRYPIIRSIPPINSEMPWDVLATYVYLDSLARFDNNHETDEALKRWTTEPTVNDTLRWIIKYLYKVVDYNPIIFRQYVDETELKGPSRYVMNIRRVWTMARQAYKVSQRGKDDMRAIYGMLSSDYVLRVKVDHIDSMPLKYPGIYSTHLFRVWAEVVDTLKGHAFSTCEEQFLSKTHEGEPSGHALPSSSGNPCITFNYEHANYPDPNVMFSDEETLYPTREPAFVFPVDSGFAMRSGQEAIVLLSHQEPLKDSTNDYYSLQVETQAWNALLIANGQVHDPNHVWMDSPTHTTMGYEEWKQRFAALREKIMRDSDDSSPNEPDVNSR